MFIQLFSLIASSLLFAASGPQAGALPSELRARIQPIVDSARSEGLPVELLLDKAAEGVAKGVAPGTILTVVSTYWRFLGRARSALGPGLEPAVLAAGASALQSGVADASLRDLKRAAGERSLIMPLVVLTDLVARGVAPQGAADAIRELTARGSTDADLVALRSAVARASASGRDPMAPIRARLGAPPPAGRLRASLDLGAWRPPRASLASEHGMFGTLGLSRAGIGSEAWVSWFRGLPTVAGVPSASTLGLTASRAISSSVYLQVGFARSRMVELARAGPPASDTGACLGAAVALARCGAHMRERSMNSVDAAIGYTARRWDALVGVGSTIGQRRSAWLDLRATHWIVPVLGVSLAAGGDVRAGGSGMGLRTGIVLRPFTAVGPEPNAPGTGDRSAVKPGAWTAIEAAPDSILVTVALNGGEDLVLRSGLTAWRAVPMRAAGRDRWVVRLPAVRGVHHVQIRFGNGLWTAPPGLPAADDGYGGLVGIIVI